MEVAGILDVSRDSIYTFFKICLPIMLASLAVGLVISFLQAVTQIQEQTVVYIPKIIVVFLSLLFMLPFMGEVMDAYMNRIMGYIVRGF